MVSGVQIARQAPFCLAFFQQPILSHPDHAPKNAAHCPVARFAGEVSGIAKHVICER